MNYLILVTAHQLMIIVIFNVIAAFPCSIILKRMGISSWWALACLVPAAAIIFLWYLAFSRWPSVESANVPKN